VARHSGAATCRVSLLREDGAAVLVIEDDGRGFDESVPSRGQGLGNLHDRSGKLGGSLSVTSGAGGTRVEIRLPV
jgi:two-component system sensor histidine kinase UhpB